MLRSADCTLRLLRGQSMVSSDCSDDEIGLSDRFAIDSGRRPALALEAMMKASGILAMKASDKTVQLIWEGLLDTDGMCRYYGYLAVRLERLSSLLQICAIGFGSGAFLTLMSHFPAWVPAAAIALSTIAGIILALQKYLEKAGRCAEIYRNLARQMHEWERLWADVDSRDDADLRAAWDDLSTRQAAIVERAPFEVPLSKSLAGRSYTEADRIWAERHATS